MTREDQIIANLKSGHMYRLNSTTTGVSHSTITYDPYLDEYHQATHFERYNPVDDEPLVLDAPEAVDRIIGLGYQLMRVADD